MNSTRLILEYRDKIYYGCFAEISAEEFIELEEVVEKIAQGKTNYLSMEAGGKTHYFTEKILSESIITIESEKVK